MYFQKEMILFSFTTYNSLVAELNHINHSIIMLPVLICIYSNLYPQWYSNWYFKDQCQPMENIQNQSQLYLIVLAFQFYISELQSYSSFLGKNAFSSSMFDPFFKATLIDRYQELLKTVSLYSCGNTIMVEKLCHDHIQKTRMRMVLAKQI